MVINNPRLRLVADYPDGALRLLHRQGELVRLRRGAYVLAPEPEDRRTRALDRCVAVARRLRVHFAFSHDTAVLLHQLPTFARRDGAVHVTQSVRPSGHNAADIIRHVTHLPASDVATVEELPVTTLDRTCLDCLRTQSPERSLAVADAVLRRLAGTDRFQRADTATVEQNIRERWSAAIDELGPARGVVRARAVIAHADAHAESPAESQLRWRVLVAGFAAPRLQGLVTTDLGAFYPDLLWTGKVVRSRWKAIALEYDGAAKYESADTLVEEKRREDALRSAGCLVLRATAADLREPGRILRQLQEHVELDPDATAARRGLLLPP